MNNKGGGKKEGKEMGQEIGGDGRDPRGERGSERVRQGEGTGVAREERKRKGRKLKWGGESGESGRGEEARERRGRER